MPERQIAFSEFQNDDGSADPRLVAAIESGDHGRVLAALSEARMLVPVVALLGFTCTTSLGAWQPDARPMPATTTLAATAAVQEGADAIVIDVGGPHTVVIESDDVRHLAAGHHVVRLEDGTHAWAAAS